MKFIPPLVLTLQTLYCWWCFRQARWLVYDDNYGLIIHAFIISLVTMIALWILAAFKPKWAAMDTLLWVAWLVLGSPLSFIAATVWYNEIFGKMLYPG